MKRLIILAVILLSATIASAQEGRNIYNKYSGGEGVTAVYISPSMFKLIGKLPNLEIETESGGSMDLAPLISSFKGFYMLDISNPSVITEINKEVNVMISKGRYDLLMEVKDEGDNVQIYTSGDERPSRASSLSRQTATRSSSYALTERSTAPTLRHSSPALCNPGTRRKFHFHIRYMVKFG
jgi:hypothetical protein